MSVALSATKSWSKKPFTSRRHDDIASAEGSTTGTLLANSSDAKVNGQSQDGRHHIFTYSTTTLLIRYFGRGFSVPN